MSSEESWRRVIGASVLLCGLCCGFRNIALFRIPVNWLLRRIRYLGDAPADCVLAGSLDGYRPAAIVKYRHKLEAKEYDFIVEFERTRSLKAIFEENLRLNEKIGDFRKYGLSKQTKFLYVFTSENFDVTTRPVEYEEFKPMIQRVEKKFGQLLWRRGDCPRIDIGSRSFIR